MSDRPSCVRWWVLGVTTLASFLLYLDRMCVNFAAKSITVEFQATLYEGWFVGAFFWSYALFQVPSGMLSDRFGIRRMLVLYILSWSVFTAVLGLAQSFWLLIVFRLLCGLAQAGAYPSAARAVRDWMPFAQRGTASSIVALGGRIGGAAAPLLTAPLMVTFALWNSGPEFRAQEILDPKLLRNVLEQHGIGPLPAEDGNTLAEFLNALDLATYFTRELPPERRDQLPLEVHKLLRRHADEWESMSPQAKARLHRQLWEQWIPKAFTKLEARGWRPVMVVYGAVGLLVAAAFWVVFRETPATHPWTNDAERKLIGRASVSSEVSVREPFPWKIVLMDRGLWGNCLMQFGTNVGWVFLATTLPRYLEDVHHVPVLQRGLLASLPAFAALPALLFGGPWTDWFTHRYGRRWGRRLPIVASRFLAVAAYGLCVLVLFGLAGPLSGTTAITLALIGACLASIATDLGVPATWAYAQDVGGRHTAAILGWGNMWGNLGAAAAPPLYSWVLGKDPGIQEWMLVFGVCAGGFLAAAVGALGMDASRPIDHRPQTSP